HGVPAALAEALEERAAAFFALPHKDKLEASARPLGYGSKSIGCNGDVGWLEYILLSVGSGSVAAASLPPLLRAALEEYTDAVREVGARVLELMADGLGVAEEHRGVLRRMVAPDEADELVRVNHYPPCPCPLAAGQRGVTGFGEHTDPQIISVLRSNRTGGLQIMLPDGRWVPVAPDPDSLFVNVGDSLQVGTTPLPPHTHLLPLPPTPFIYSYLGSMDAHACMQMCACMFGLVWHGALFSWRPARPTLRSCQRRTAQRVQVAPDNSLPRDHRVACVCPTTC
uniref:Fe2OG dioxygenase domain-containing protein n=1 Tax=Aegilops tauschii subsp. strangulata TaxID=200361 RepID=A0A452ZVZ1_AEGTS